MTKDKRLHVRVDEHTHEEIIKAAERENRSVSNYILNLFREEQKRSEKAQIKG